MGLGATGLRIAEVASDLVFHIWNAQGDGTIIAKGHPLFANESVFPMVRGHVQRPEKVSNNPPAPKEVGDYGYTAEGSTAGIATMLANWVEYYDYLFQTKYGREFNKYALCLQGWGTPYPDGTLGTVYGGVLTKDLDDRVTDALSLTQSVHTPFSATGIAKCLTFSQTLFNDFNDELTARGLTTPSYLHMDMEHGLWLPDQALTSGASGPGWFIPTLNDSRYSTEFISGSQTFKSFYDNKRTIDGNDFIYEPLQNMYKVANFNLHMWLWGVAIDAGDYAMDTACYQPAKAVFPGIKCGNYGMFAAGVTSYDQRNKIWMKRYAPTDIRADYHSPSLYPLSSKGIDKQYSTYSSWLLKYNITDEGLTQDHLIELNRNFMFEMVDNIFGNASVNGNNMVPWLPTPGNSMYYEDLDGAYYIVSRDDALDVVKRCIDYGCRQFLMWQWDGQQSIVYDDILYVVEGAQVYYSELYGSGSSGQITGPYVDDYEDIDQSLRDGDTQDNYGVYLASISNKKKERTISKSVKDYLPSYFREAYPELIEFLEAYYEWLETTYQTKLGNPLDIKSVADIDNTFDDFVTYFKKEFLHNFPEQLAIDPKTGLEVNEKTLLKQIKQFYAAKGTQKSYELLFRIVYNTNIEFYFPKVDILRISDGKWIKTNTLKLSSTKKSLLEKAIGGKLIQRNSNLAVIASGVIKKITSYQQGGYEITEVELSSTNGTFLANRDIQFVTEEGEVNSESLVYSTVNEYTITNGGSGYAVGDVLTITNASGDAGYGASAEVFKVSSTGAIQKIKITNFGANYRTAPIVTISSENGTGATITASVGALCSYPGYYANSDGIIDSRKRIQDNHYYQDYSYVIKTEITIDRYRQIVKELLHPAGFGFFGQVLIKRCLEIMFKNRTIVNAYELPRIGNYLPYLFETHDDLPYWFFDGEPGGTGYDPGVHDDILGLTGAYEGRGNGFGPGNPISSDIDFVSGITNLGYTGWFSGDPYWITYHHPNTKGMDEIPGPPGSYNYDKDFPYGMTFGGIRIYDFFHMPAGYVFDCANDEDNSFPPPNQGGLTNDYGDGSNDENRLIFPESKNVLYLQFLCSSSSIIQLWLDSNGTQGRPRGFIPQIIDEGNYRYMFDRIEQYRTEAALYGVDLGIIMWHPLGYGTPGMVLPIEDTGVPIYTRHRLDEVYRCLTEDNGAYVNLVDELLREFSSGSGAAIAPDTLFYLGSYPKTYYDDKFNGADMNKLKWLMDQTKTGLVFDIMSAHNEDSPLYQSIEQMHDELDHRWWCEAMPHRDKPMAQRGDVIFLANKVLWDAADEGRNDRLNRSEVPPFCIQWINHNGMTEEQIISETLEALNVGGLTMGVVVDLYQIKSEADRINIYKTAAKLQKARRALYRYDPDK